jgi:hypothetical protein
MQLRIVRLTIPEFLVTIAHLPLGSFLPVRRAEGNSLAKSIPVALCTLGPNIGFDLPVLRYRARVHAIPAAGFAARPYFKRYSNDAIDLCDVLSSFSTRSQWAALLAASVVSYVLLMMPGPRFAAANDFLP